MIFISQLYLSKAGGKFPGTSHIYITIYCFSY